MSADDVTLNPVADAVRWLNRHLPRWAKVALPVVIAAGLVWWQWEHVSRLPGVSQIVEWWETEPLPEADPDRFAVAITHLENDPDGEHRELITDALRDIDGVQILRFDQAITLTGGDPEEVTRRGHERARALLDEAGADVLIWGRVLTSGGQGASRLYWTTSGGLERRAKSLCQPREFKLPTVFWDDLRDVLRLLVVTAGSLFPDQTGQFVADRLEPFTAQVRGLLKVANPAHGWESESCAQVSFILANSLSILGEQSGLDEPLNDAVALYREVLETLTRERAPLEWARTQNNLGTALGVLGEREPGTARLEEAVAAFKETLKEHTRERVPLDWAMTQSNLGSALLGLGMRELGTTRLEEAVAAFKDALKERTRERVPLQWATTQDNLGNALTTLGERGRGTARLEEAVAAFKDALKERTRERVPLYWAMTQNNLGNALTTLGERGRGTARLEEAVAACKEALKEFTRERVPLQWATTQGNLGDALATLGERSPGTARLEQAVAAYNEALKERIRERVPLHWAVTQSNLGNTLRMIAERTDDIEKVCDALGAHLSVWEFLSASMSEYVSVVVEKIALDTSLLLETFPRSEVEACLSRHEAALKGFLDSQMLDGENDDA